MLDSEQVSEGETLDILAKSYGTARKRFRSIKLIFGWKLIKEEKDEDLKTRIMMNVRGVGK